MNSFLDKNIDSNSIHHPHSLDIQDFSLNRSKPKYKISHKTNINKLLFDNQRKKISLKNIESYIHKYFIHFYKNTKDDYNIRMIDDILNNESSHLVAEFKDYLIMGDITEFLQKSYNIDECRKYLPKIYDYYNSCSVIFPNYVTLHESKYIYKSIRKKQKVIDNQQEQEEKQEKIKKGDLKLDDNDEFFSSKTFNSILDQTNTSNVKCFFGINNDNILDANETPNNIVAKLEQAEKEVMQRKINLVKNKKNLILNNNNLNSNYTNENHTINSTSNNSSNLFINNNKLYIKSKYLKDKNKGNIHYLSSQNKNNLKINMNINNINFNNKNPNKIIINSYLSKNNQHKNENDSKKYVKSSTNITDTDNENISSRNNYITFYGNNFINSKRNDTRKLFIENNDNKPENIYIRKRANHSNKNIKKQYINSLFPTKNTISKIFNNLDNNSVLKHNSFNFINKRFANKNLKEENNYLNSPNFPLSPSSITIEGNRFMSKYNYNLNINIKESNSSTNVINNHKIKERYNSNQKLSLKNIQDKIKRNNKNHYSLNFNSYTISTTTAPKSSSNRNRIKYIHTNKNYNYNKELNRNNYLNQNFNNFRTIVNNTRSNIHLYNKNNNNINYNGNNINYINNINIKDLNIQKFNSTSNIKNPINMNININMNNNSKNKIYFNEDSCGNIIDNKIYNKNLLNLDFETIRVSTKKRIMNAKSKKDSDNKIQNIIFNNNYNGNIVNSHNNNTLSNDKNYYFYSLGHSPLNTNNQNEDIYNGIKNDLIMEELNKKKNLIVPIGKEINSINVNGYDAHRGCLTSRTSNNVSKKKYKGINIGQENNYYNKEFKIKVKNKSIKKTKNNLISRNENNPVKIKRLYDNIQNINNNDEGPKITGYFTSRNK